jgi:AcrR family transcriptional regulator
VNASERPGRTRKAEQSEVTRAALVAVARQLFAQQGFADTSVEQIVRTAHVTRGALYHHYRDKHDLFRAVFESVEQELVERLLRAAARTDDPLDRIQRGFDAFLDACLEPAVQRIILIEGPSVLGWDEWQAIDARYMFGLIDAGLRQAIEAGAIDEQPTEPLAHLLLGAASQAGLTVARDRHPRRARAATGESLRRLIAGLARPARARSPGSTRGRRS